jgi:hypothetical protein
MKKSENDSLKFSIYIQVLIALLLINLIHKIVREIPGSMNLLVAAITTITAAVILIISIILLLFKRKEGLILGLIPAAWATFQWVIYHVIMGNPDINGIWWYPIFPIVQGLLIIYFSILAWKNEESFNK